MSDYAQRAFRLATLLRFSYGSYLSLDLWGHARLHAGAVAEGLQYLRQALILVKNFGDGGSLTSLQTVMAIYETRFGHQPLESLQPHLQSPAASEATIVS